MIVDLLKQLAAALPRFVWYQIRRPFITAKPEPKQNAPKDPSPSFENLPDDAGLDPRYTALIAWPPYRTNFPTPDLLADPLYQKWAITSGGQKWSQYFWIYRSIFDPIRHQPLRVLEIGVMRGSSLKLWKEYFDHPDTQIVGIDIQPDCRAFDSPENGIHVRIGSQADASFLKTIIHEFGKFDLIIDDGSHISSHIIASFNHLFADGLNNTGIYFVEDLHANYWPSWRDTRKSFLDVCKELLEHMNGHYARGDANAFLVRAPSDQPNAPLLVPKITTMIREMRFYDSIVVIYKANLEHMPFMIVGE